MVKVHSLQFLVDDLEYEVFNPPPVSHQKVAALDQKLHNLQMENKLLTEKVASLEQSKLSMSLQKALERIECLENEVKQCLKHLQSSGGKEYVASKEMDDTAAASTMTDPECNRKLLEGATSDQVCRFASDTCKG